VKHNGRVLQTSFLDEMEEAEDRGVPVARSVFVQPQSNMRLIPLPFPSSLGLLDNRREEEKSWPASWSAMAVSSTTRSAKPW
jgi:hypothetical protein